VVRMSLVELSVSVSVCGFADEVIVLCMEPLCVRMMQLASFTLSFTSSYLYLYLYLFLSMAHALMVNFSSARAYVRYLVCVMTLLLIAQTQERQLLTSVAQKCTQSHLNSRPSSRSI
jgi:hypothetical protein